MKWISRLCRPLALAGLMAFGLAPAQAQVGQLYWQCVAPSAAQPGGGQCPVNNNYPLPTSATSNAATSSGQFDIFGQPIVLQRYPQFTVDFHTGAPSSLVGITTTGNGTATNSAGHAVFSTG